MTNHHHLDLELRHIKPSNLRQLSTIIDKTKAWKELLDKLSKPLNLTLESIHLIDQQHHCGKSPTLALLNHWSITGRRRPTIRTLIHYLRLCNLKWAEDYIWREILQCHDPQAMLPAAATVQDAIEEVKQPVDTQVANKNSLAHDNDDDDDESFVIEDQYQFEDLNHVISRLQQHCPRYSFKQVYLSTNRFCHRPFDFETGLGRRIGDGRFSSVFLAQTHVETGPSINLNESPELNKASSNQETVAAKLLKSECKLNYLVNEINLAMRIRHENILELLGISVGIHDGQLPAFMCLIYPYMENGSLLDCLSLGLRCQKREQIKWLKRVEMAIKIGRGVSYLHTLKDGAIIHRDVKTANILIGLNLDPKLGDFTLVRQLDSMCTDDSTQYSHNIIGTSVYMPPEAFRGDISTKFDIFSFGIVLFELLSGRRPFDEDLSEDLLTFVSEKLSDIDDKIAEDETRAGVSNIADLRDTFLLDFLDSRAGGWPEFFIARVVFDQALRATEVRKRDRPEMIEIVGELEKTLADYQIN